MLLCTINLSSRQRIEVLLTIFLFFFGFFLEAGEISSFAGSARGESEAIYLFVPKNEEILIPSIVLNGFSQKTEKTDSGILVNIKVNADPLRIEKEWRLNKSIAKKLKVFDPKRAEKLIGSLYNAKFIDEAVLNTFIFVRKNWNYTEKNDGELSLQDILNSKEASCYSFCKICKGYFEIMGIETQIAIGIKFPLESENFLLKGAALHSWLKITIDKENEIFCDPLSYFGFVPQQYIYLSDEENYKKNRLQNFKDSLVKILKNKDRIFYNPESQIKPILWRRSPYECSIYGLVLGKALKENDFPLKGTITIKGFGKDLQTDLFQGNFYFFIKSEGIYSLFITFENGKEEKLGDLDFSGSAVKKVVYYVKEKI